MSRADSMRDLLRALGAIAEFTVRAMIAAREIGSLDAPLTRRERVQLRKLAEVGAIPHKKWKRWPAAESRSALADHLASIVDEAALSVERYVGARTAPMQPAVGNPIDVEEVMPPTIQPFVPQPAPMVVDKPIPPKVKRATIVRAKPPKRRRR